MKGRVTAQRIGSAAALAYLAAVAVVELLRHTGHGPRAAELASSPAGVVSGHLWRLLTSGFVVAGAPVPQLAGLGLVVVAALTFVGPRVFWLAAFAGHVVATLVTYAGVGVLWLVARADVDDVVRAPDYGISCVWAATLGLLIASGISSGHRRARIAALWGIALALVAAAPFTPDLAGAEHLLAFAFGAAIGVRTRRRAPWWQRPAAAPV